MCFHLLQDMDRPGLKLHMKPVSNAMARRPHQVTRPFVLGSVLSARHNGWMEPSGLVALTPTGKIPFH